MRQSDTLEFEWDSGNIVKSYRKHGITPNEAEGVFLDERAMTLDDVTHSANEKRLNSIGKTLAGMILFVAFTLRGKNIRIISARLANNKERRLYEEKNV